MKNTKAKLAFEMLEKEMEVVNIEQQKEFKGGDGVIRSGTGTASDPYVISSEVFFDTNNGSSNYSAMSQAINQINSTGAVNVNGKYYKFNISQDLATSNSSYGINPNAVGVDKYGQSYSYRKSLLSFSTGISPGSGGSSGIGTTSSLNQVTIYQGGIDAVMNSGMYDNMSESEIIRRSTIHEMGHVFGIDIDHNPGGNASQNFSNGNAPGMFDSRDIQAMLNSGKIHWANESTGTAYDDTTFNPNNSPMGSTGLISQYQENDGSWWNNFYYFDDTDAQYNFGDMGIYDPSNTHQGFSTGYKKLNTGEIFANPKDEYLYLSTGYSTEGDDSTGVDDSTEYGSTGG